MKLYFQLILLCLLNTGVANGQDGTVDLTFGSDHALSGSVSVLALQKDGKILIGGNFNSYQGFESKNIARLHPDGSIDTTFKTGTGADRGVYSISIQPDNKIIIAGYFKTYNGVSRPNIARLDSNGTLDSEFDPGTGVSGNYFIHHAHILDNGKILAGGGFTSFNGINYRGIVRLKSNGEVDSTFYLGTGVLGFGVYDFAVQPDGKIIIVGNINKFNGVSTNNVLRLKKDGEIDDSFNPGEGASGTVRRVDCVAIQSDGKILIGGAFSTYDGVTVNGLARMDSTGKLDEFFQTGSGATYENNGGIYNITIQENGKIIISGDFTASMEQLVQTLSG